MSDSVASLDIFDTVLTRRVGEPYAVFLLIGRAAQERGLIAVAPADFARERIAAQRRGRQRAVAREVTVEQIYQELAGPLSLSPTSASALSALEMECEAQLICAVPGIREWISALRGSSSRVIFISDMYLPAAFIRARLIEHGCWRDGDVLYVSCEHAASKQTGALFRLVLEQEKLSPDRLHHVGNHVGADFSAPRQLGIAATFRPDANLNRYEEQLETFSVATQGLASLHAGASRLARLSTPATSTAVESIRHVAAGVAGPVLASYVSWLLREARQRDIARLYFVARDGHLLLQLARQLAPQLNPGVELRYLHGSRQAWHLPGLYSLGAAELDWLFCRTDFLSVATVCARLGLAPAELSSQLTAAGFSAGEWDQNLSSGDRNRLRDFMAQPAIAEVVLPRAVAARENLLAYLAQEKLLTTDRCALVDVGWHGRAQDSLAKVIRAAGFPAPEGFYFGLNSSSGLAGLGDRHAWFFDRRSGESLANALPGIEPLIEAFCTAGHGVTAGYARTARGIEPVLRAEPAALQAWGWPTMQATLLAYGRELAAAPLVEADKDATRAMSLAVLQLFWETPTLSEAVAWGAFPYEDDQTGSMTRPLAEPLPWQQAADILLRGRTGLHRAAWWQGSQQLTPPLRRGVLACAHRLRQLARAGKSRLS